MLDSHFISECGCNLEETEHSLFIVNHAGMIVIPKITPEDSWKYPKFRFRENIFTVQEILKIIVEEVLPEIMSYKIPFNHLLQHDIDSILDLGMLEKVSPQNRPVRRNAGIRSGHKIRIIKDYKRVNGEIVSFSTVSQAIREKQKLSKWEIESFLEKETLDISKVDSINKLIFTSLPEGVDFKAPFYGKSEKYYYTLFENKPDMTARLAQAITSDGLLIDFERCEANPFLRSLDKNILNENSVDGGINTVVAYVPKVQNNNMFLSGEIFGSPTFSKNMVVLERTIVIPYREADLDIIPLQKKIKKWDTIATLKDYVKPDEKNRKFLFHLQYPGGRLIKIKQQNEDSYDENENLIIKANSTILTFLIKCRIGSGRVVSENGIKGCTIPLNHNCIVNTKYGNISVDLVIGPNAIKAGSNTIKAGSYAFRCHSENKTENMRVQSIKDFHEIPERINKSELIPGVWKSPFGNVECYLGVEHIVITDTSNDYTMHGVRLPLEHLRFMHISKNKELVQELLFRYRDSEKGEYLNEVLGILCQEPAPKHLVYTEDVRLKMQSLRTDTSSLSTINFLDSSLMLDKNKGLSFAIGERIIRLPSARLIKKFIKEQRHVVYFPDFGRFANLIIRNLQRNDPINLLEANLVKYYECLQRLLLSKKGLISRNCSVEIEGGHLRQLPFHLVPKGVTVLVHPYYEGEYSPLNKYSQYDIWDIGCRNPVLWLSMLKARRLWTFTEFEAFLKKKGYNLGQLIDVMHLKGCVLRSPLDCMEDQSDADGDLYPLAIPSKVQHLCRPTNFDDIPTTDLFDIFARVGNVANDEGKPHFNQPVITKQQQEWLDVYRNKENKTIELKPFTLSKVSREQYKKYYISGAIAKGDVAFATVSLWQFHTAIEIAIGRGMIDYDTAYNYMGIYASLLQDYVIRGIKHSLNTSTQFDIFLINNMSKPENYDQLKKILLDIGLNEADSEQFIAIANIASTDEVALYSLMPNGSDTNRGSVFKAAYSIRQGKPLIKEDILAKQILEKVLSVQLAP